MNKILIITALSTLFILHDVDAQELKTKTKTKAESGAIEIYQVLKSDKKVMHGDYEKKTIWDQLVIKGRYIQNKRVGIWDFYDYRTGLIEQQYDYDKNEFIILNTENSEQNHFKYNDEWIIAELDLVPVIIGGLSNLRLKLIQTAINHIKAPNFPKAGTAVFSFVVTSNGQTTDFKISQSSGNSFEKYILKIIEENSELWLPGIYKGEKVDTEFILPMNIKYQENNSRAKQYTIDFNYPRINSQEVKNTTLHDAYITGESGFFNNFVMKVRHPPEALRKGIMGLSVFSFKVDCEGIPYDFIFTTILRHGIEKEIKETIMQTNGNWRDCNERNSEDRIKINIVFSINQLYNHDSADVVINAMVPFHVVDDAILIKQMNKALKKKKYEKAKTSLEQLIMRYPFNEDYHKKMMELMRE